jgi:hypothetical protein
MKHPFVHFVKKTHKTIKELQKLAYKMACSGIRSREGKQVKTEVAAAVTLTVT